MDSKGHSLMDMLDAIHKLVKTKTKHEILASARQRAAVVPTGPSDGRTPDIHGTSGHSKSGIAEIV